MSFTEEGMRLADDLRFAEQAFRSNRTGASALALEQASAALRSHLQAMEDDIAKAIHYPECWDDVTCPTLASALSEMFAFFKCTNDDCVAGEIGKGSPS